MRNFSRVLRLALRRKFTFAATIVCALGVAILWGGNISAVYPFVEVVFQGESLQEWVQGEIAKTHTNRAALQEEIDQWEDQLVEATPEQGRKLRSHIELAEHRITAEATAEKRYLQLQPYLERYLPHDPFTTLAVIIVLLLVGTVLKDLFLIGNTIFVARLAQLSTFQLRKLFYRRTLRMNLSTFGEEGTADLMSRFTHDTEIVANGVVTVFGRLIVEPMKMMTCLLGAAVICWRLLLLSLVVAPLAGFLIQWLGKTLKRANRRAMEEMAHIYAALEETFRGIKIVKAFTNERQERRRFHHRSKQYYKKAMRIARYNSLSRPITELMGILTICLALLAGAWLVLSNETHLFGIRMSDRPLSLGSLLLFYGLLAGAADPIRKLSDVFTRIQRASAAADRVYDRLDREPEIRDPQHPVTLKRHQTELTFEHVDFAYGSGHKVLNDVSLRIPFGQTVAIVGPNGCGKSTLANLIPRFYDPAHGTVRLDGISLKDLRLRDLRKQIGLVSQETLLFDDTVLNNIRYGTPHATREQVIAAAIQANAHQFIENDLADGYDTMVGALGGRLSGGQRQRIALARAILRDPAIIILDEATSQVDLESEQAIQEVLEEFVKQRTAIMITHRMSILSLADRIIVMQAGEVLDFGTHDELLSRCDLYQRLHQIQFDQSDSNADADADESDTDSLAA